MKSLVIYYSLEGNTEMIAKSIASEVNADILELKPKKDIHPKGFLRYVWGGKQVLFKEKPELFPLEKKIQDYDLIFMGTPVWASTFAPAFNTLFSQNSIQNKKIALFCCYAGQEGKTFKNFKDVLNKNDILGEIGFKDPEKYDKDKNINKVKLWANNILKKV